MEGFSLAQSIVVGVSVRRVRLSVGWCWKPSFDTILIHGTPLTGVTAVGNIEGKGEGGAYVACAGPPDLSLIIRRRE